MSHSLPTCRGALSLVLFCTLALTRCAIGQTDDTSSPQDTTSTPLVIQTIPESELPKFLTNERPIRRSVFNDFLKSRDASRGEKQVAPEQIQILGAAYDARLSAAGVLEGAARVEILSRSPTPVVVPVPGLRLAITKMKWKDRTDPVRWGLLPDRRLVIVVPKSGELELEWSLPAAKKDSQWYEFDLGMLKAARTDFTLTAPRNWKPSFEGHLPTTTVATDVDLIRHHFQLGTTQNLKFRLENSLSPAIASPAYWIRMSNRYDIGRQGADIVAELELETTGSPIARMPLRMDRSLQLVSAKLGDQVLSWAPAPDGNPQSIELHFDPPLAQSGRKVRLEARAELPTRKMESLPRIHPLPSHLREAEMELNIAPPLELAGIELSEARLADTGAVLSPRGGESRRIRLLSPAASIRCAFHLPEFGGKVRYAAKVTANDASWELDALCRLHVESGERFDLSTIIPSAWIVDSVESAPAGEIENWSVAAELAQQRLSLRLLRPLTPKTPLAIRVVAHMPRVGTEPLLSKVFRVDHFDALSSEGGFLQLIAGAGVRVDVGAEARRVNPKTLQSTDLELIAAEAAGTVYELSAENDFSIAHAVAGAEFRVASVSRVLLEPDRAVHQHRLIVTPQRQQLDRLLIHLQPPSGQEVTFDLDHARAQRVSAKLVGSHAQGDLWEVRFSEPISEEFSLSAMETTAISVRARLRTLRCDGAATHDSTLRVFGINQRQWDLAASGVQPLQIPFDSQLPVVELGAFRFSNVDSPSIEVVRKELTPQSPRLWSSIDDRVTFAGDETTQLHASTYYLEAFAGVDAQFYFPQEIQIVQVRLNRLPISSFQVSGSTLTVPLPASRSTHLLEIEIAAKTPKSLLGISSTQWQGAVPRFATLSKSWTIWSSPGSAMARLEVPLRLRSAISLVEREPVAPTVEAKEAISVDPRQLLRTGWRSTSIHGEAPSTLRIIRYSDSPWRLTGWCLFVISLAVTRLRLSRSLGREKFAVALVIAAAVAAVFVPAPVSFLLSGAFLGGVIGWLIWSVQQFVVTGSTVIRASASGSSVSTARATLVLFTALVWSATEVDVAFCQSESKAPKATDAPRLRNVFDPVDQDDKPAGDYVYVSPEFFDELARHRPAQGADPSLLVEAHYRLARSAGLIGDSILLGVELVYFAATDAEVVPLWVDVKATPIANREIFVDGQRNVLADIPANRAPQVELAGRGLHTIKLNLQIPLMKENDFSVATVQTLPLAKQHLEIEADSTLAWRLNGADIHFDTASPTSIIPVTPGSELKLAVRRVAPAIAEPETPIEHDAWITISPGAVNVEHRVETGPESAVGSILFELDERFQLDSVVGDNRQAITPISLGNRRYRARLESPIDEAAEIRIFCSSKSALDLNQISSTGIRFPSAQITKSQVAISAASDYALQAELRTGVTELSPAEFTRLWPPGRALPRLSLAVEPGKSWRVDLRPASPAAVAALRAEYLFHPTKLQIQWEAEVTSGGEPRILYVLQAPPNFQLDAVSVQEGAVNRLVRFARTDSDRLTLFMRTASLEPRKISIRGSIPLEGSAPIEVPTLSLENTNVTSQLLRLFRADNTQLEIKQSKGVTASEANSREPPVTSALQPEQSRVFGEFEVSAPSQPWELQVMATPNAPQINHESVARFIAQESKWRLQQDFKLSIQNGVVDELILEMPPGLQETVEISPQQPFQMMQNHDQSRRMVIRPDKPWKDSHTLRVTAEYSPENGPAEMTFSPLRLTRSTFKAGYIAAPRRAGIGAFAWKGLGSDESPPPPGETASPDTQWFQQRDDRANIQLQRGTDLVAAANTRLEGIVSFRSDRFVAALTWFWGGASAQEVTLSAPESLQILSARVVGSSARLTQLNDRVWRLSSTLGSAPPVLEVICQGRSAPEVPIPLPSLEGAETQEALITLHTSREWTPSEDAQAALLVPAAAFEARLHLLDKTKRDTQTILPTLGEFESLNWSRCWLKHWDAARGLPPHHRSSAANTSLRSKWLEQADADRARFAADLDASAADAAGSDTADTALPTLEVVLGADSTLGQTMHFFAEGKQPTVKLVRRDAVSRAGEALQSSLQLAPWSIPIFIGGILVGVVLLSTRHRRALLSRIVPVVGWLALGVIWWLWLAPSWFGPVIATAAIMGLLIVLGRQWSQKKRSGSAA